MSYVYDRFCFYCQRWFKTRTSLKRHCRVEHPAIYEQMRQEDYVAGVEDV